MMDHATGGSPTLSWHRPCGPAGRPAIVFIHGFTGDKQTWSDFLRLAERDKRFDGFDLACLTYRTRLIPDIVGIWSADAPIGGLAGQFHTCCRLGDLQNYNTLVIVAHSMGGLVAQRALVDNKDLRARVTHLFFYGTPSGGLKKAQGFASWLKRQAADMAANGEFIADLRGRWASTFTDLNSPRAFAAAGVNDEFVPSGSVHAGFHDSQKFMVAGNHLEIVHLQSSTHPSFQLLVRGLSEGGNAHSAADAAALALERRDFQAVVDTLEPLSNQIDDDACVTLALALEGLGRGPDALALLEKQNRPSLDAKGVLAGRLKRRWLKERRKADAERATALYTSALKEARLANDIPQLYYHAINSAFLALAFEKDEKAAKRFARIAQRAAGDSKDDSPWRHATQGEAALYLGNIAAAMSHYREALRAKPTPRETGSIFQQARTAAGFLKNREAVRELDDIFGNKVDMIDGQP